MKRLENFAGEDWKRCHWRGTRETFLHLACSKERTQSQNVVRPLHWYIACRLVIEGGFLPDEIKPHPPFAAVKRGKRWLLGYDEVEATGSEATILGGLKTKNVDVVVEKPGIGPVIAISCKTTGNAFRNLTNRMEEAVGECTNLHMTYPALVTGFFSVLRAHREGIRPDLAANDVAVTRDGNPVDGIVRYHDALRNLEGRADLRDTISKYEAVASGFAVFLSLIETSGPDIGRPTGDYPPEDSSLRAERFFETIYRRYHERFVLAAPTFETRRITPRIEWDGSSPLFKNGLPEGADEAPELDYEPRLASALTGTVRTNPGTDLTAPTDVELDSTQ